MNPFYVGETSEAAHLANPQEWWRVERTKATAAGGTWSRYTADRTGARLLFECWKDRPCDEGAARWGSQTTPSNER